MMDGIIQDVASIIKYYYKIQDNANIAFGGITKAALATFKTVDDKVQVTGQKLRVSLGIRPTVVKSLPKSIDDLKNELKDLERTREVSLNLRELTEAGKKIASVKGQIAILEKKVGATTPQAAKKAGGGSLFDTFSKSGAIGMAVGGFMKIARAAGDAEDKTLGIKRDKDNVLVSNTGKQDPSKTINGQISSVSDGVDGILGQVGLAVGPFITKVLGGFSMLIGMVPNVLSALQPLFDVINSIPLGQIFNDLGASIQSVLHALQPVLTALQPLLSAIFSVVAALADKISSLVGNTMTTLGPVLTGIAGVLSDILGPALEMAGSLFGKLLDLIGWVVGKVGDLINFVKDLFSTVDDGTQQVSQTAADKAAAKSNIAGMLKHGQKDETIVATYNEIGGSQGTATANAALGQYGQFAAELDKQGNTVSYRNQFEKVREIIEQQATAEQAKTAETTKGAGAPQRTFATQDASAGNSRGSSITDGGKKSVVINIGKFFDNMNITAQKMSEGIDDFERRVEEVFLRIVNSASAANE